MTAVRLLDSQSSAGEVTRVLCDAFAEYPVMHHVLGDRGDYTTRLRVLIGLFVGTRVLQGDALLGISNGAELLAAAICTLPDTSPPPALEQLRERTWAELGADARERYGLWTRAWDAIVDPQPNLHVNMVGVPPRHQGRGLGRALLERAHRMSREREESIGVTLTTERAANVPFYEHLGYRVLDRQPVAPGLETWGFFRPD
jgi:GNAT superfamily N-acetyltransferase